MANNEYFKKHKQFKLFKKYHIFMPNTTSFTITQDIDNVKGNL